MCASRQLEEENKEKVRDALLSRHRHQHEVESKSKGLPLIRSLSDIGKKYSQKNLEQKGKFMNPKFVRFVLSKKSVAS